MQSFKVGQNLDLEALGIDLFFGIPKYLLVEFVLIKKEPSGGDLLLELLKEEFAPYWFDMKGMKSSPFMSYAVKLRDPGNMGK